MDAPPTLRTTAGDIPLTDCRLAVGDRTWAIHYTTAVVTRDDRGTIIFLKTSLTAVVLFGVGAARMVVRNRDEHPRPRSRESTRPLDRSPPPSRKKKTPVASSRRGQEK